MKVDDIMQDDHKDFNKYFLEQIDILNKELYSKFSIYEDTRTKLEDLVSKLEKEYNTIEDLHCFNNNIEQILYMNLYGNLKRENVSNIPIHFAYYYLGLSYLMDNIYDDALKNFQIARRINPYFNLANFNIVRCYRKNNDLDTMYDFLMKMHNDIYNADSLSLFYTSIGDYSFDKKNYGFANTLYSLSEYYKTSGYNQKQLTKISLFEGRVLKVDPVNQIIPYLREKKIPTSVSETILFQLLNIYKTKADNPFKLNIQNQVKTILYGLTKNESFAPLVFLRNDEIGFTFSIPELWEVLSRSNYNIKSTSENTLFVIKPISKVTINVNKICELSSDGLFKKYREIKNQYINNGYVINYDSILNINGNKCIQSFIERQLLNEKVIVVHNYIIINKILIDFDIPINFVTSDKDKLYNDKNVQRINNILLSIKILTKKEEVEFTF